MNLTVDAVNDGPDATDNAYTTDEDTPLTTGNVLANDTDLDGDTLTVDSFTQPAHGTVTYNNDGTFTYTPAANYHGSDSFTYTISDGNGGTDTATVNLTVDAVNDGPDATDNAYTTDEDTPLTTGNVLANDTDLDGDTLTVDSFTQPAHGTVTYNNDGTFTYTPAANYHGSDSFTYTVSDGNGGTDTATVNLTVDAVNDGPDATDNAYTTDEDTPLTTGNVLANDTDLDGDSLSVDSFTQPAHGTVTYNNDGTFTYTPAANYHGSDSFTYTISDGNGGTDTATVSLSVDAVDDISADAGPDQVVDEHSLVSLFANVVSDESTLSFSDYSVNSYAGGQDAGATVSVEDDGATLHITGNGWKSIDFDYEVTSNTVLEFDFRSDSLGEVHGIGFDNDNGLSPNQTFKLYGTQNWGLSDYADYTGSESEWKHYRIEVGDHFTGSFDRLFFANDHDGGARDAESMFRGLRIYEDTGVSPVYTYSWTQLTGPLVDLDNHNSATPTFTAPNVSDPTNVTFRVTVSDGHESWDDEVMVTINPVENYTEVDAGPDQTVDEGAVAALAVAVNDEPPKLSFSDYSVNSYAGGQDAGATVSVEDDGATLHITGNGWKSIDFDYEVTSNTVLEFDFRSDSLGEVHGIGFDNDNGLSPNQTFKLYGTQNWGLSDYADYTGSESEWKHYRIEVGDHFTGSFDRLFFANDHDGGARDAESMFRGLRIYEDTGVSPVYTYSWTQLTGPLVDLDNHNSATPTFTAPNVSDPTNVTFRVTVSDGHESWDDEVMVTINPVEEEVDVPEESFAPGGHEIDQGLAVAADEAAMRNVAASAEGLLDQSERWLAAGLEDLDDGGDAARSAESTQSASFAGGGAAGGSWDIETEVVASDDLTPATYIHSRAVADGDDAPLDDEPDDVPRPDANTLDEEVVDAGQKAPQGALASLWGLVRALGGTRRPDDPSENDRSRGDSTPRR